MSDQTAGERSAVVRAKLDRVLACSAFGLGDLGGAFVELAKAKEDGSLPLLALASVPELDALRNGPRVAALRDRVGRAP